MPATRLQDIRACVFDAYGTLFDVHSAVGKFRPRLGDAADRVSALWRTKQLEYTWLRSLMRHHADFWQVTGDALDYALDTFGISDSALRRDLMDAYLHLECYPDVHDTLARLKRGGLATAILSNGSPAMLAAVVENTGLGDLVDLILSVEEVGVYKPDPRVYHLAMERLGLKAQAIAFISSNGWDAVGAAACGLRVAWINRAGQRRERLPFAPEMEVRTLGEMAGPP
ncbi:MAG: haloacid dehalogenase type II [Anaerolineae bacterium]|nr:haloacid dehalogenase type II [Anaerolineae bacterium]